MHNILVKPLYTEKLTKLMADSNVYGFIVDFNANKIEIKKAVEKKFNVKVLSVNTLKHKGKRKTQFRKSGRFEGFTPRTKKAFVHLAKDNKIELFEQV